MTKIFQDESEVVILTPEHELREQLLRIEKAGRTCYQSEKGEITPATANNFVRMLLGRGHESVIEHTSLTVQFNNCSRGMTHELVRHRLASFSQESTRYVNESDLHFVMPPGKSLDDKIPCDGVEISPRQMIEGLERWYRDLLGDGWKKEDARQFLPIGTVSQIVCTANWRQWRHMLRLRTDTKAHWEIRGAMKKLGDKLNRILSVIFDSVVT